MLRGSWLGQRCLRAALCSQPAFLLRRASTDTRTGLPNVLLERARKIAAEHDTLNKTLADDFDDKTAKRVGDIAGVALALREYETATESLIELRALLDSDDAEMRQLAHDELKTTTEQLNTLSRNLSTSLTPKDSYADLPCLLEVRPGPGGIEARLFGTTLFQMYKQYCLNRGLRTRTVKYETADGHNGEDGELPLQEAVLEVQTPGAYDLFRGEAGMHRVQRVPATEKSGRTHTSAVAVWVLPSFPEDGVSSAGTDVENPDSEFYIDPAEVRMERMRASGAGGQHVNKVESAVRLTHIPTGTVVSMQDSRSQSSNRSTAWALLRSRVASQRREARQEAAKNLKDSVLAKHQITRGDKIRTYNYGQDRCTDHRAGVDVHNLPSVLIGGDGLDKIMNSVREWLVEKDLQGLLAEEEAAAAAAKTDPSRSKR